jgi:hypothetical protein
VIRFSQNSLMMDWGALSSFLLSLDTELILATCPCQQVHRESLSAYSWSYTSFEGKTNKVQWRAISLRFREKAERGKFVARHHCRHHCIYKSAVLWGPKKIIGLSACKAGGAESHSGAASCMYTSGWIRTP